MTQFLSWRCRIREAIHHLLREGGNVSMCVFGSKVLGTLLSLCCGYGCDLESSRSFERALLLAQLTLVQTL